VGLVFNMARVTFLLHNNQANPKMLGPRVIRTLGDPPVTFVLEGFHAFLAGLDKGWAKVSLFRFGRPRNETSPRLPVGTVSRRGPSPFRHSGNVPAVVATSSAVTRPAQAIAFRANQVRWRRAWPDGEARTQNNPAEAGSRRSRRGLVTEIVAPDS
jgi:hypothetical protein